MSDFSQTGFGTRAIHVGGGPDPATGARAVPIYQSIGFVFDSTDHAAALFNLEQVGYIYSRLTNPTVNALQTRLASLEGGAGATCTSSGHAAQLLAMFPLLEPGLNFVASTKLYGGSVSQFSHAFRRMGWEVRFRDPEDIAGFEAAIDDKTRAVFVESIANPGGIVTDLEAIAALTRPRRIPLIVDNTLATPYLCRPFEHGADLVVHSTTKFLTGNGTSLGGVVIERGGFDWKGSGKFPALSSPSEAYHGLVFADAFGDIGFTIYGHAVGLRDLGVSMAPANAFQTLLGIETLGVRMERHCASALQVAEWLQKHSAVSWVSYAGLKSDPWHARAAKYAPKGAGAVFTFGLKGGYEAGVSLVNHCKLLSLVANIGDCRSLIIHPASTTHRQLPDQQRRDAGAGPDVIRLSIGLEDPADIIEDLDQAMKQVVDRAA